MDVIRSFYNIENEAGVQTGANITEQLQNAVNRINDKTTIYIPGTHYNIDQTILFPNVVGGTIYGAGFGAFTNAITGGSNNRNTARLIWTGNKNEPMFKLTGANLTFDGALTLIGKHISVADANRASIGILMTKGVGIGTGKTTFNNLMLRDCDVMFQCGLTQPEYEQSNDNLVFNYFVAEGGCDEVYRMNNLQTMHHTFNYFVNRSNAPKTFYVRGGGLIHVKGGLSFETTFLYFPSDTVSGSNQASFNICNMKVDSLAGTTFKAVVMDKSIPADITFDRLFVSNGSYYANNATLFDVYGRVVLTLKSCRGIAQQTIKAVGQNTEYGWHIPNISCHRMAVTTNDYTATGTPDLIRSSFSNTKYYLSLKDCYTILPNTGGKHVPIDDYKREVT